LARNRRKHICAERTCETSRLHALYGWGASFTLITHAAAEGERLDRVRQPTAVVAGLSGGCTVVDFHYMVPIVDEDDRVRVVKAMAVDSIAAIGAMSVPTKIAGQGLGEQAGEAGKGGGVADWHGQSEVDASPHRKQSG
jgi:hypothetical protein